MHLAFHDSLSSDAGQVARRGPVMKQPKGDNSEMVIPIIIGVIFVSVFIPLFYFMYRAWRWEKANILKNQPTKAKEEGKGNFEKAELSSDSSVIIHEMENVQETQELSERKEGLSHELPGSTALPQELPAALHEMPAEGCDEKSDKARQSERLASKLEKETENVDLE
ncbi:hypothetical protein F5B21DRAFT_158567 [Xylaria acuta]|nr:hypothetical protein F5B21DRAFT_158567 [Xylaria acuta]